MFTNSKKTVEASVNNKNDNKNNTKEEPWQIALNHLEKSYCTKRETFRNKVERYYRQGMCGKYVSEDELITDLKELNLIRTQMVSVCKGHEIKDPKSFHMGDIFITNFSNSGLSNSSWMD